MSEERVELNTRLAKLYLLYDITMGEIEAMPDGPDKARAWAMYGLDCDGGHHKQWYLERVLEALDVKLEDVRSLCQICGYAPFKKGSAP